MERTVVDKYMHTALDYAKTHGHRQVQELLVSTLSHTQLRSLDFRATTTSTKWSIPPTEIEFGDFVATKDIGGDFLGTWLDAEVAIKLYLSVPGAYDSFDDQVTRWFGLRHPNVQKLYGAVREGYNIFVCEQMANGSLEEYVETITSLSEWNLPNVATAFRKDGNAKLANFSSSRALQWGGGDSSEPLVSEAKAFASDVLFLGNCLHAVSLKLRGYTEFDELRAKCDTLVQGMRHDDSLQRCNISAVVLRMKSLLELTNQDQAHQDEVVSASRILSKLQDVWSNPITVHTYEEAMIVLETIQGAIEQQNSYNNSIQRLSSSYMYNEMEKRWSDLRKQRIDVFVSEIDNTLTLLHPTETEDLLTLLHRELQNTSYSEVQHRIIQKAYDEACSTQHGSIIESLPEWFIGCSVNAKSSLNSILASAETWIKQLGNQLSTVDFVKAVFRGFSLHRQIDRVLAEHFIAPTSEVHGWADKCFSVLQAEQKGACP
ncbi:hypothetical protein PC111_g11397 [Phytophthora cactorum]|nr:hypothetical protein PC111_g11397 [Phytophthora cactorum]